MLGREARLRLPRPKLPKARLGKEERLSRRKPLGKPALDKPVLCKPDDKPALGRLIVVDAAGIFGDAWKQNL
jgi:hypothetical protein